MATPRLFLALLYVVGLHMLVMGVLWTHTVSSHCSAPTVVLTHAQAMTQAQMATQTMATMNVPTHAASTKPILTAMTKQNGATAAALVARNPAAASATFRATRFGEMTARAMATTVIDGDERTESIGVDDE